MTKYSDLILPTIIMALTVAASNILVSYPVRFFGLEHLLTYSAIIFPFVFLTNDFTNRLYGPKAARQVVYIGFVIAFVISLFLASFRISVAASIAFLFGQLLDIAIFTPLRSKSWWIAPLCASVFGCIVDSAMFFSLAFAPQFSFLDTLFGFQDSSLSQYVGFHNIAIPLWLSITIGSLSVKLIMSSAMVLPYGAILLFVKQGFCVQKQA